MTRDHGACGAVYGSLFCRRRRFHSSATVLDCRRVEPFRLRFPGGEHADLNLGPGVHGISRDGGVVAPQDAAAACAQFCVDRRGVWLRLADDARGVHVNGRPVRRMAMLRVGDAIWLDGAELLLLPAADVQRQIPEPGTGARGADDTRVVLRGVGGQHHGRCFNLSQPRVVGRLPGSDIRIDEPAFAERQARLELRGDRVLLRGLVAGNASVVNGEVVHDAVLRIGDQIVFGARHRFVVEAPGRPQARAPMQTPPNDTGDAPLSDATSLGGLPGAMRRLPWLLLAALLIAAALGALLLFGVV